MSGQTRKTQRRASATFAMLAAVLLIAGTASAASETTTQEAMTMTNNCNGESITYSGKFHMVNNTKPTNQGLHINLFEQRQGKGIGDMSLAEYNIQDQMKSNAKVPRGPVVIRQWQKAQARDAGTGPVAAVDYWQLVMTHINPDGSPGPMKFETRCKPEEGL